MGDPICKAHRPPKKLKKCLLKHTIEMSDSESIEDIESSYEESIDSGNESDTASIQQEYAFDNMLLYLDSIIREQVKSSNKIKRSISLIKSGLNTKKKVADEKRKLKKIIAEKKRVNKSKTHALNIEFDEKVKQLNETYENNKLKLCYLYSLQKNTIHNVKFNRMEFFKNCPDNLKPKIFTTIVEKTQNKVLKKFIQEEYLLDEIDKNLHDDCGEDVNIFDEFNDADMTIGEIFSAMQSNATGRDYMKFVMFINMFEFNRFIKHARDSVVNDGYIKDIEALIDELPEFLTGSEKESKLREIFRETTEFGMDHIAKFLMYKQTSGLYYQALIFLAEYYKIEHRNCVPMFDNLDTGDIKEEALGIYITLRAYQTDDFIADNYNYMNYILQEPQQISWLSYKSSKKTDLTIPAIRTNHEFNEKHHKGKKYKLNDAKKRSYAKIRGRHTIYFYFDTKQPNTRKNIKSYLCDEYMSTYVTECRENAINAILLNSGPRDQYIFQMLKLSLEEQIASIDKTLDKYSGSEIGERGEFKYKIETQNFKQSILYDLNDSQIALDMFACKASGYISFQKLCELFSIENNDKCLKLKLCLSRLNIIEHTDIDENNIKLSWKQLNQTIIKFDSGDKELLNILYEYWLELNESYEKIILRIQTFYENIVCDSNDQNNIDELIREQINKLNA